MNGTIARGVGWTALSFGGARLLNLLTTAVLARLLVPADFGVVALAMIVVVLVSFVRDLGLSGTLVSEQGLDRQDLGILFAMMLGMSLVVCGLVVVAAPLAAAFFDEPRLVGVLRGLSIMVALGGVIWFYDGILQREMAFRRRFVGQFVQNVLYGLSAVALALAGFGVWSLVVGQAAGAIAGAVAFLFLSPYRVRPCWNGAAARRMLSMSHGYLLQWVLSFIEQNVAVFAIGRVLDPVRVGYYVMSYRIAELPAMAVADPVARVTLPAYAQMRHREEEVTEPFLAVLRLVVILTVPAGLLLSACAELVIVVMLGSTWLPMTAVLVVLGFWVPFQAGQAALRALLNATGHVNLLGRVSMALLVPLVPGLLLASSYGGVVAVAAVVLGETIAAMITLCVLAHRSARVRIRRQWRAMRPAALAAPGCWGAAYAVTQVAAPLGVWMVLPLALFAGAGAYVLLLVVTERGIVATTKAQLWMLTKGESRTS